MRSEEGGREDREEDGFLMDLEGKKEEAEGGVDLLEGGGEGGWEGGRQGGMAGREERGRQTGRERGGSEGERKGGR